MAPRIVVIETTCAAGGVAVAAGHEILASADLGRERDYASTLVPTADRLCRQVGWRPQEIEHVYVSIGPGSFSWAGGRYEKVEPERLVGLQEVVESVGGWTRPLAVVGEAAGLYRQQIEDAGLQVLAEQFWMPTVRGVHAVGWQMAQAGQFCDADELTPRYIRLPSPVEKMQARKGSPPRK